MSVELKPVDLIIDADVFCRLSKELIEDAPTTGAREYLMNALLQIRTAMSEQEGE